MPRTAENAHEEACFAYRSDEVVGRYEIVLVLDVSAVSRIRSTWMVLPALTSPYARAQGPMPGTQTARNSI